MPRACPNLVERNFCSNAVRRWKNMAAMISSLIGPFSDDYTREILTKLKPVVHVK